MLEKSTVFEKVGHRESRGNIFTSLEEKGVE